MSMNIVEYCQLQTTCVNSKFKSTNYLPKLTAKPWVDHKSTFRDKEIRQYLIDIKTYQSNIYLLFIHSTLTNYKKYNLSTVLSGSDECSVLHVSYEYY